MHLYVLCVHSFGLTWPLIQVLIILQISSWMLDHCALKLVYRFTVMVINMRCCFQSVQFIVCHIYYKIVPALVSSNTLSCLQQLKSWQCYYCQDDIQHSTCWFVVSLLPNASCHWYACGCTSILVVLSTVLSGLLPYGLLCNGTMYTQPNGVLSDIYTMCTAKKGVHFSFSVYLFASTTLLVVLFTF